MEDSIIIWKYLTRALPDDSLSIYLYCTSNYNQTTTQDLIKKIMSELKIIFSQSIETSYMETVLKAFLDMKKKQYQNAEIKLNPIY